MKQLKIFLTVAAAGALLVSCDERQFTPVLGDTTVEFVNPNQTIQLTSEYINIPIQMTEQSSTGAKAVVEFTGGTITPVDGTPRDVVEFTNDQTGYENGGDIIITSKEIYIGAYDVDEDDADVLPFSNMEIRVPDYRNIQTLVLNFEIVSDNAGDNRTVVLTAEKPTELAITGTWTIAGTSFTISQDDSGYQFTYSFEGTPLTFGAVRDGNNLTIDTDGPRLEGISIEQGGPTYDVDIVCWVFDGEMISASNVVLSFTDDQNMTVTNGMFMGFLDPEDPSSGMYYQLFTPIAAGTAGTK